MRGENRRSVIELIPNGQYGCVLTTSRDRASVGALAYAGQSIEEMPENEAIQFLLKCCRQQGQDQEAKNLVNKLGCLPLAIEQAGGYIWIKNITIDRYNSLYDMNKPELLKADLPEFHKIRFYKETVATTWKISFDEVDVRDPLAGEIMRLMTFLDGVKIQKELFEKGGRSLPNNWRLATASVLNVENALGCLQSFSLIRRLPDNDIAIHLLVQQVILGYIETEVSIYFGAALMLIKNRFRWGGDLENLSTCLKYLSQARSCVKHGINFENTSYDMTFVLISIGSFFVNNGQYNEAMSYYKRALKICDREFGVDHINSTGTIMGIGTCYGKQGKYNEAMSYYERALKIYDREFGVDHINSAGTIMGIGNVYEFSREVQRGDVILRTSV